MCLRAGFPRGSQLFQFFAGLSIFVVRQLKDQATYQIALCAARDASAIIMQYYKGGFGSAYKADGSPVTEADLASSKLIGDRLQQTGIPITGEEEEDAPYAERAGWEQHWCVDPLDGTKEFIRRNGEFAVNIALIEGQTPVFGIIAAPVEETVIFGGKDFGVFFSTFENIMDASKWVPVHPQETVNEPLVMTSSRTHHSGEMLDFINQLKNTFGEISYLRKGSSLKFFDLALGHADVYVRFAPTMEWDIASGQAILEGLGGTIVHAETGEPLVYNKPNLLNPHFVAKTSAYLRKTETSNR
jgi:3'(2'), 5'-bisphosphate nucleotidase